MRKPLYLLFAAAAYALFFATFLYLVAFVGDLPWAARTVDAGPAAPAGTAVAIDLALIALFGLQHSVMARPGFKRAWTRVVPEPVERSIYVVMASVTLILLMALWRPIGGTLWRADSPAVATVLWILFGAGWLIVLLSTFMINHFDLFGLAQPWRHLRGREAEAPVLREPFFYRFVRHPLYTGFFLAFWAAPEMSRGHALLAAGLSAYMLIAIRYEERDLVTTFGLAYEEYRGRVGMLTPRLGRRDG